MISEKIKISHSEQHKLFIEIIKCVCVNVLCSWCWFLKPVRPRAYGGFLKNIYAITSTKIYQGFLMYYKNCLF